MLAPTLPERLAAVRGGIADAALAAGRNPAELTTVVVTKFQPATLVRELAELGVRDMGESRHQEAQAKAAELEDLRLRWHFVGQLQSKKARQVRAYSDVIHSVDRPSLVSVLASETSTVDCFVQVALGDDPGRGGVSLAELDALTEDVAATPGLNLRRSARNRDARSRACARHPSACSRSCPPQEPSRQGCPSTTRQRSPKGRHTYESAPQSRANAPSAVNLDIRSTRWLHAAALDAGF
jgi:hypothetical protein